MNIALDTSELKKVRIRVDDGKGPKRFKFAVYADAALPLLIKIIDGRKPKMIGVVVGPGAFSATRTGVALANALAYGFDIPIVALNRAQFDSNASLASGTRSSVSVYYGASPNITKKKVV